MWVVITNNAEELVHVGKQPGGVGFKDERVKPDSNGRELEPPRRHRKLAFDARFKLLVPGPPTPASRPTALASSARCVGHGV